MQLIASPPSRCLSLPVLHITCQKTSQLGRSRLDLLFPIWLTSNIFADFIPSKWLNSANYGKRPILRRERPLRLSQRDYWRACDCQAELRGGVQRYNDVRRFLASYTNLSAGELQSVDGYMNIALEKTEEYVNGHLRRNYGDAFVRGNNGSSMFLIWSE